MSHEIIISRTASRRFRVTYQGETLIEEARDPEHEACRALLALRITGTLLTRWKGSNCHAMRLDIERDAGVTIDDTPRRSQWTPPPVHEDGAGPRPAEAPLARAA